jgi:hypothetical protein
LITIFIIGYDEVGRDLWSLQTNILILTRPPFQQNDLDLDLYTGVIIHEDLAELKKSHCRNAFHSHRATKMAKSISVIVEETIRSSAKHRNDFDAELDEEDETLGNNYGLTDDFFGISEDLPS